MRSATHNSSIIRGLKFNLVGAIGIAVQLGMLSLLTALGVDYMLATAVAVESAVLHNFLCHERFTWTDRRVATTELDVGPHKWAQARNSTFRLLRFNLTTGAVSIGGNLLLMRLLVGQSHIPAAVANLLSIAGCSLVNFLVSDRWVFRAPLWPVPGRKPSHS